MDIRRLLWGSIVFSTLLYGVLAYATERNYTLQPLSLALRRPVVIVLYLVALSLFFAAVVISAAARQREVAAARLLSPGFVVRLALFEGVAIIGLCAAFVDHDWRIYLPAWALALLGFLRTYPAPADAR